MRKFLVLGLFICGLASGCAEQPSEPVLFESRAGGFSILVPASLQEKTQDVESGFSKMTVHAFIGGTDLLRFFISYLDYDEEVLTELKADEILRQAQAQLVSSPDAVVLSEAEITLNGYPGREITFDTGEESNPELSVKARIFLVGPRLYQIMVMIPKGDVGTVSNNAFLESFSLLPR
jgi:hypothetical protein